MLGGSTSPDPSDRVSTAPLLSARNKPQSSAVTGAGGSSKQRAAGDAVTPAPAAGRAAVAATASAGGVLASMVGMYQHQLQDDPFGTLGGGHCGDQPRLAAGVASPSSPSVALAPPLAQALGGGETRRLLDGHVGGGVLRGCGKSGSAGGDLETVVRWVRELALDPVAARTSPAEDRARKRQVRALRRARYLRLEDVTEAEELPSFRKRKHKGHNNHWEDPKRKGSMNVPTRKSERLAKRMKLMTSLLLTQRKKIGVGEHFQVEVPDWTGQPSGKELSRYRDDPETSKFLGTRIWPPEGEVCKTDIVAVGQGRPESCDCPYPGSFFCNQYHINETRDQLRSELGQAFTEWQFDSMGEQVSKQWSREEQSKLYALERLVPVMDQKTFWSVASKNFSSRPRSDLIKYYLNVFLMRRVSSQCRLKLLEIDSDEDEVEEEEDEKQPDSSTSSLQRTPDVQDVKKVP